MEWLLDYSSGLTAGLAAGDSDFYGNENESSAPHRSLGIRSDHIYASLGLMFCVGGCCFACLAGCYYI